MFVYLTGAGWFWVGHSLSLAQFWAQSTELIFSAIADLRQAYSKGNTQQFFLECSLVQPGGKKNPFFVRPYWAIMTPYAQPTLPEE